MKVLILTYYWPPAGGSGVQRWLKFAKYLPDFNITPVVYTAKNAQYPNTDASLVAETKGIEILQKSLFNPVDLLPKKDKKNAGITTVNKKGILSWLRGNLFIPDPKIFWVTPSIRYLTKYIQVNKIDAIISSGPPHSMHLIGLGLQKRTGVKWIADFRDPWSNLYYQEDFNMSKFSSARNKKLEQKVLKNANAILTVSTMLQEELPIKKSKIKVITNGFDDEVLTEKPLEKEKSNIFKLSYIGLFPKQSNPVILWEVLQELRNENTNFKKQFTLDLTGDIAPEIKQSLLKFNLEEATIFNGYVPHKIAIKKQQEASVLLVVVPNTKKAKGIVTGKIFEYLKAKRPIVAIGPENGDLATILNTTKAGNIFDFKNKEDLKKHIKSLYKKYLDNNLHATTVNIQKYHRKTLTQELANFLKETVTL